MHRLSLSAAALLSAWLFLAPSSAARAAVLITVDKSAQQMTVTVDGERRWVWPVSTGRRGYDTPSGSFKPFRMEEDHYSKEWDDAPMPHSIFFTGEGHAIHGSFETRNLGRRASHGCVRLAPKNAARLFALVKREGVSNARVVVMGDPNAPLVARRKTPAQQTTTEARDGAIPGAAAVVPAAGLATDGTAYATNVGERAYGYAPPVVADPAAVVPPAPGQGYDTPALTREWN